MKFKEFMTLQLFADPAPGDPNPPDPELDNPEPADPKPDAKYTDEDLDKIINKKFAEWQGKKQKEIDEAKRLAGMNAQEKAEHERDELKEKLNALLKQQNISEMSRTARGMFAEKNINISDELLAMIVSDDADITKKNVESFVSLFSAEVKKAVTEALRGEPPKTGSNASSITREQILSVKDRTERQKLIQENMELFK